MRRFQYELNVSLGNMQIDTYVDIVKFFDTLSLVVVIQESLKVGISPQYFGDGHGRSPCPETASHWQGGRAGDHANHQHNSGLRPLYNSCQGLYLRIHETVGGNYASQLRATC